MSDSKPFFSVIIPTYNRANLLNLAIKSVLQQSFEDFEIVISNSASTDNTREVVQSFNDSRIRYFESKEKLAVGDNYQNGLDNARGEYFTFLSDDDAYSPILLQRAKKVVDSQQAEIVGYQYCRYYHDDLYDFERKISKNSLLISDFTGELTKFTAQQAVEQIFVAHGLSGAEENAKFIIPYLSNAVYHHDIFTRLKTVSPKLFHTVPPDMYLAAAVFFVTDYYYCLDEPLLVWSNWKGNATASAQRETNALRQHYEKLLNGRELLFTPLKFPLPLNCGVNAILQAKRDFENNDVEADWAKYFIKTYENFVYLQSTGINTSQEMKEFADVLKQEPIEIQNKVKREITKNSFAAKKFLNTRAPALASFLRKVLKGANKNELRIINGKNAGFNNVSEAAQSIDQNLLESSPHN